MNRRMRNDNAALGHHRHEISIAQPVGDVPADAQFDDLGIEAATSVTRPICTGRYRIIVDDLALSMMSPSCRRYINDRGAWATNSQAKSPSLRGAARRRDRLNGCTWNFHEADTVAYKGAFRAPLPTYQQERANELHRRLRHSSTQREQAEVHRSRQARRFCIHRERREARTRVLGR